ncbi:hypothetical protein BDV12DRAFT_203909 [Aspergillus spectabilis]
MATFSLVQHSQQNTYQECLYKDYETPGSSSPTPTPTPTPTPSPRPSSRPGLGYAAEIVIVGSFGLIVILSVVCFWMHGDRKKDGEEYPVEKSPLAFAEKALDTREKDPLLQGYLEDDDVDAPPPYAKHEGV